MTSQRIRSTLVVIEVAMTIVLLIGAGLMARSFTRLMAVDPGFNPERVVTVRLSLPDAKYPAGPAWTNFHRELLRRVAALPGIDSVGLNSTVPLEGGGSEAPVIAEGDPMPTAERPPTPTLFQTSSPDYFRAMGIPLLKGRVFTDRDTAETTPVVVVDESLVRKLFPQADPIGKRIAFEFLGGHGAANQRPSWREIVGVVRHVRHYGVAGEPPFVQLYTPYQQLPIYMRPRGPAMALVARTALEPDLLAASIRREIAAIDPDIPIYGLQTMEQYLAQNTEQPRLTVMLLTGFGALALMLAIVGIYGVLSYTVSSRTQEIGIRLALGATRGDVVRLIVGYGMTLAGIGAIIGLAVSWGLTQSMRALLYDLSPHDPVDLCVDRRGGRGGRFAGQLPVRRGGRPGWIRWLRCALNERSAQAARLQVPRGTSLYCRSCSTKRSVSEPCTRVHPSSCCRMHGTPRPRGCSRPKAFQPSPPRARAWPPRSAIRMAASFPRMK